MTFLCTCGTCTPSVRRSRCAVAPFVLPLAEHGHASLGLDYRTADGRRHFDFTHVEIAETADGALRLDVDDEGAIGRLAAHLDTGPALGEATAFVFFCVDESHEERVVFAWDISEPGTQRVLGRAATTHRLDEASAVADWSPDDVETLHPSEGYALV